MEFEKYEDVKGRDKRQRLGYMGLATALACWIAGAMLFTVSDRTTPYLIAFAALCAIGAFAQHVTYKLAERLRTGS